MSTVRIQVRRGNSTGTGSWNSINPILAPGEIGLEVDTNRFKFGQTDVHWNDLPYALEDSLADYIPLSLKGQPDGVAELDADGLIPVTQLPPLAKVTVSSVADESARLALTAQVGDIAIQTDTGASYVLQTEGASTDANWKQLVNNEKVQDVIGAMLSSNTETGITVTYQDSDGTIDFVVDDQFTSHTTSDLSEGTNLYFTNERAQDAVGNAVGNGLKYDDATGAIEPSLTLSGGLYIANDNRLAVDGYYVTFNGAEQTLTNKTITSPKINENVELTATSTDLNKLDGMTATQTELNYLDGVTSSVQNQIDGKLSLSGGTMTGDIILSAAPTNDLHPATKLYVDNAVSGINFHEAVVAATTINLSADYANGTDGVGATLTSTVDGAWTTLDGYTTWSTGKRILVKNQTDQKQNGIYTISDMGDSSNPWVLIRATDADNNPSGEIKYGDFCLVLNGTQNGSLGFVNTSSANPISVGSDLITYTPFNAAKAVTAGLGLAEDTPGILTIDYTVTQNDAGQTLTNKTINLHDNAISGTIAEFNSALSDANFATVGGVETLINKTIDSGTNTITVQVSNISDVTASALELNTLDGISATTAELNILNGATLSTAELNKLDGLTSSTAELNILSGVTASSAELNILDGVTASAAEINILDGVTASTSEINILDGALTSTTELNYVHGVTSDIQTQINSKLSTTSAASTYATLSAPTFTGTVVLPSTTSIGTVSATEIGYLDGVTGAIQTQIDQKQAVVANVSDVEIGYLDGVTSAIQTQINAKSPSADPTFTGTVVLPSTTSIGTVSSTEIGYLDGVTSGIQTQIDGKQTIVSGVSSTEIGYLDGVTSAIQTQINTKAPLASPTFTGHPTIEGVTATGATGTGKLVFDTSPTIASISGITTLNSVAGGSTNLFGNHTTSSLYFGSNQTTGFMSFGGAQGTINLLNSAGTANKTVNIATASTGGTTAITIGSSSGATSNVTLNGTISLPSTTSIGNVSSTEIGYLDGVTSAIQTQLDAKAPLAGPTFTGTTTTAALTVTGNLTVQGTTTTVSSTNLEVTDPLIYIGTGNSANASDLGLVGHFDNGTYQHTGIVRDATDGKWKLFSGVTTEPSSTIDFTTYTKDTLVLGALDATSATIGSVTNTEIGYLSGVTSAIQTQLNAKLATATASSTYASIASPTLTGTPLSTTAAADTNTTQIATTAFVVGQASSSTPAANGTAATGTSLKYARADHVHATDTTLAPKAAPTFTGLVTLSASGIAFTDGTQTREGVISRTPIIQKTASYTLSALTERDSLIEVSSASATTVTIPLNSAVAYPVGTSIDILQTSTGQVTIAGAVGVTVNATPGLKLRTTWSSCTLFKRATDTWVVYGDLTA